MLKLSREKMEDQLDEEIELERRLAEIKAKKAAAKPEAKVLMVQVDEEAYMEYWSTDSDDEEMRKPTHGALFVESMPVEKKEEIHPSWKEKTPKKISTEKRVPVSKIGGSCFMVKAVSSEKGRLSSEDDSVSSEDGKAKSSGSSDDSTGASSYS